VFANFMLVPRGETVTSFFSYELPVGVVTEQEVGESVYSLIVQKQPGMKSEQLTVTVTLPQDSVLLVATPTPAAIEGTKLIFVTEFDSNQHIMIRYR
jgi:MinD superfamily P-loop ATPase